jgi:hypothetical protein
MLLVTVMECYFRCEILISIDISYYLVKKYFSRSWKFNINFFLLINQISLNRTKQ